MSQLAARVKSRALRPITKGNMTKKDDRPKQPTEEATEFEYLKWFRCNADFGPADSDVKLLMNEQFERETGKRVPEGWEIE